MATVSSTTFKGFNVTRVNEVASKKRLLVPDRTDMKMASQRHCVGLTRRSNLQDALMIDYNATVCSRGTHHEFLVMMLNEVHQYHKNTFNVVLPRRALEIVADHWAVEMRKEDMDHYADCLSFLSHFRPYSAGFHETALELVASDKKNTRTFDASLASAGNSSTSCGLSDDGH